MLDGEEKLGFIGRKLASLSVLEAEADLKGGLDIKIEVDSKPPMASTQGSRATHVEENKVHQFELS